MYFSPSAEIGKIDFSSKAKGRHQFVSIVVEHDVADLMECLLVLTAFGGSDVVQRSGLVLYSITGCEINADDHRHLHSA